MNEKLNRLLKFHLDDSIIILDEYELLGLLKDEKYKRKVLEQKQEVLNNHYKGLFKYEARSLDENEEISLLKKGIPYILKTNKEKERVGIYIDKVGILAGLSSSTFMIPTDRLFKENNNENKLSLEEEAHQNFREELRKIRSNLKTVTTPEELKEFNLIDDRAYDLIKTLSPSFRKEAISKYIDHLCKTISKVLIDSKTMMKSSDLDITDEIGKYIDTEKFALWYANFNIYFLLSNSDGKINYSEYKNSIDFVIGYYKDLMNKINNNPNYIKKIISAARITEDNKKGIYTTDEFIKDYTTFYENYLFSNNNLDSDIVKELTKVPPKEFSLDWEILPEGHTENMKQRKSHNPKSIETIGGLKAEKYDVLEAKEKLLNEKKAFFESTCPVLKIKGTNKMSGYYGFVYPNGKVVFEKFYKGKYCDIPTVNEAIYVMRIDNFRELSKYSKPEIIEYINDNENSNVKRIYHAKNWKEKVIKSINSKETNKEEIEKLKQAREFLLKSINNTEDSQKVNIKK